MLLRWLVNAPPLPASLALCRLLATNDLLNEDCPTEKWMASCHLSKYARHSKLRGQVGEWHIHPHYGKGGIPVDWDIRVFGGNLKSKGDFGKQARQRICI